MLRSISFALVCCALMFVTCGAKADQWDKRTVITFSQPVELPGVVLPAGTYVFKLANLPDTRAVVQVFNADENKLFATILAIADFRPQPRDKTFIGFAERSADLPLAIREWFYPGDRFGIEFVYSKVRARELARETGKPVMAAEVKPAETPAELLDAEVIEETSENTEVEIAAVPQPTPLPDLAALPAVSTGLEPPAAILPQTGSPVPMVALAGLLCLAGAGAIKVLNRGGR